MVSISTATHTAYTTLEASYWSLTSGSLISTYQTHQITLSKNQNQTDVSIGKIFVDPNRNTTKQNEQQVYTEGEGRGFVLPRWCSMALDARGSGAYTQDAQRQ